MNPYVEAAEEISQAAQAARGRFTLALSGGSSPRPLFALLATPEYRAHVPWERTHVFFADERPVPPDHAESNFRQARELLLTHVPLPPGQVHRLRGEAENLSAAAKEYEWELAAVCAFAPGGRVPCLDVVLLGIGDDGHTASLFPETAALREEERWVMANWVPRLGVHRLTLTYPALEAARRLLFVVTGAEKAEVVRRVLAGEPTLPASRLAALLQARVLADDAARGRCPRRPT
jgi:6-phosphogluconolactonase